MPKNLVTLPLVYGSIFQYHENGFRGDFFGALGTRPFRFKRGSFDFIKPALIKSDSSKKVASCQSGWHIKYVVPVAICMFFFFLFYFVNKKHIKQFIDMVLTRGWFCLENLNYLGYWRGAEFGETAQVQDYFS